MSIKIRRGPDADRVTVILEEGELGYATDTQKLYIGDNVTLGGIEVGGGAVISVAGLSPILSTGGTSPVISIANAVADGVTKGAASFDASDFNSATGVISIDYANGQSASALNKGFLTAADWNTFNNKGTVTGVSASSPLVSSGGSAPNITTSMNNNKLIGRSTAGVGVMEEISIGGGLSLSGGTLATTGGAGSLYGTATQVSAGVYTATISGVSAYTAGDTYVIKFDTANDGDSTININTLGAKSIFKNTNAKLASGDIKANQILELVYDGTNFQAIGVVPTQLLAYVHNAQGSTINKGDVVYAFGATGNKMSVKLARADVDATSAKTIGMVYDTSIAAGGDGYIIIQGVIEGLNTGAYAAGNILYLSGTTFGGTTNVKPYAPTHLVYVGVVERANAGNGQIYVRCQNGYELDEIHDVDLITTPPVNNDVLTYVTGANNLWKPKSVSTILGYTLDTDGTLAANSDTRVPSQKAVKTYADNLINAANALVYKGVIDCSTNPNYPAANAGDLYLVSVAGKIGGASGIDVEVGDMCICTTDGTPAGDQATVGANWNIIQKNIVGAVVGPASAINNNVAFFDGTSGKVIKDSGLSLSGTNTGDETNTTIKTKLGAASGSQDGYLTSTNWNTFNNKVGQAEAIAMALIFG